MGKVVALDTIDKKINVDISLCDESPFIQGDPAQIQQVILNLAVNACDAMPDGGSLSIKTSIADPKQELLLLHPEMRKTTFVTIEIEDSGHGISKDIIDRIFEPFFTTKDQGKGTGLGLSMVYGIIKNHGGLVDVKSKEGNGTCFRVFLPYIPYQEIKDDKKADNQIITGKGTILLIDDETIILQVASSMLIRCGYEVKTINNSNEAISLYEKEWHDIDLVILDMSMPGLSGHECFIKLKEINPGIKALLSTGYGLNEQAQNALDEGMIGFIRKPYRIKELSDMLTSVFGKSTDS